MNKFVISFALLSIVVLAACNNNPTPTPAPAPAPVEQTSPATPPAPQTQPTTEPNDTNIQVDNNGVQIRSKDGGTVNDVKRKQ